MSDYFNPWNFSRIQYSFYCPNLFGAPIVQQVLEAPITFSLSYIKRSFIFQFRIIIRIDIRLEFFHNLLAKIQSLYINIHDAPPFLFMTLKQVPFKNSTLENNYT